MNPLAHLRQNVVAYLALFVALGTGTAFAADQITSKDIARNAVKAKHIKDGQVRGAELAANAVAGAKVADNSLTGADVDESTLQLPPAPVPVTPSAVPEKTDLTGYVKVVAQGFIAGAGPLNPSDRCNSVSPGAAPDVKFGDHVIITPGALNEDVVFTGTAGNESLAYQACYTGTTSVNLGGDVRYVVLRATE